MFMLWELPMMCDIGGMKNRKRPYGPQPRNPEKERVGGHRSDRRGHGRGKSDDRFERKPRPPAPDRPTIMVAQAWREGAYIRGRVLQRDLVNIDFEIVEGDEPILHGEFVEVEPESQNSKRLVVRKKIPAQQAATWAAICNHGLRVEWPAEVDKDAEKLKAYTWDNAEGRADWRKLPIVTIDGADARDFDDAVWAEPWEEDGHHIIVAIADVAHYVKAGSFLDTEAVTRGNSTYFPDKVLPMLPERLSNDLCSLRPHEDRPVLGVEMWVSAQGRLLRHEFKRATIHSAARLTYDEVHAYFEGDKTAVPTDVQDALLKLRAAYAVLAKARERRGALDLDIPEVKLDVKDGKIVGVSTRARHEAHRLIEELMILANVAAAERLSRVGGGLYRIHPEPTKEKLENLKASLGPLGFTVPAPNGGPKAWAKLVAQIHEHPAAQTLLRAILQSQQQAKYDPNNIGHYGLALPLYSHFTSPIRRYADLIVHRALIETFKGPIGGDVAPEVMGDLARRAEQINATERKSQQAEWEARDRMVAQHFAGLVGQAFDAVVISVVPFGCFVAVDGVAEGLLPKWDLGRDWVYVGSLSCWRKTRGKGTLRVGGRVAVILKEADPLGGRLTFGLAGDTPVLYEDKTGGYRADGTPVMPKETPKGAPKGLPAERNAEMERPVRVHTPKYGKKPKRGHSGTTMGHPLGRAKRGNSGKKPTRG
ncbi:MAG: VacB/RNase II family 3'-5' exoribonuclease [Alphaproteobacteria bacterium]|nr:MAG: VacB/RNase II family 3'-5' exoribonuclease [Alphaproteobacteria bacterium]